MPMTILPPVNASRALRSSARPRPCRSGGPPCRSARSPRARSASRWRSRAGRRRAARRRRARRPGRRCRCARPSPTTRSTLCVEQRPLRPLELLGPLVAHRDVHVAGLVGVLPGRVDDRDLRVAPGDQALELSGDQVRGEGAPHPAAQDDDALHRPTGPSRRRSRRSRPATRRRPGVWPAFSIHFGMSVLLPLSADQTAIVSPTSDSLIARMSSISGPGQKLPRASIVRVTWSALAVSVSPFLPSSDGRAGREVGPAPDAAGLDEERGRRLRS